MKKLLIGLTLIASASSFASSDFERGFEEGKKASKGRVIIVDGGINPKNNGYGPKELKRACENGRIEQVVCLEQRHTDYVQTCAGICIND
ncbi:MAG: hypothetical protein KC478_06855 [Bacteriovoracaceae bacterium]|nr:hypothetical protein [Bacteriovoracaceae bacterium]